MVVSPASPKGAPKVIFAALDAGIARELEPQFAQAGCAVRLQQFKRVSAWTQPCRW